MRLVLPACLLLGVSWLALADEPKMPEKLRRIAPRSPEESLQAFEVEAGFRVELVAAEPLVTSPMAAEFDEDGRLYVVELPEYNAYGSDKPHGKGRVVRLEDTDGDGTLDKREVYVDDLHYPTAVFPWKGGVFVGAAPDLWYFNKAGARQKILTGFGTDKAGEGQLNSFRWHFENRILISTGLDGGDVRVTLRPNEPTKSVRGMNVLYDPRRGDFELTSGGGQHGMSMDDWGRVFVSGNSDPIHLIQYDARYFPPEVNLPLPPAAANILPTGKFTKLNRISEIEPWRILRTKLRAEKVIPGPDEGGSPSGFFTGASGVTIYRGDAYPEEYRGNAFVGEVANNLVFRAKIVNEKGKIRAERAGGKKEFLASKDAWFRPVQFIQGPDGCLYVIDMYRELIEGAAFLAPDILKQVDPSAGVDRGRIWRIVPEKFERKKHEPMGKLEPKELVKYLEHPNGWHRDTAARLIYQDDKRTPSDQLKTMAKESKSPLGRLHAMYASRGEVPIGVPNNFQDGRFGTMFTEGISDPDQRVQRHALRWRTFFSLLRYPGIEKYLGKTPPDDVELARQVAVTWGIAYSRTLGFPTELLAKYSDDEILVSGLLQGVKAFSDFTLFRQFQGKADKEFRNRPSIRRFLAQVAEFASEGISASGLKEVLDFLALLDGDESALVNDIVRAVFRRPSPQGMHALSSPAFQRLLEMFLGLARDILKDEKQPVPARSRAIKDLQLGKFESVRAALESCLQPTQPSELQVTALQSLGTFNKDEVPALVLKHWNGMTPQVRSSATELLLSRGNWLDAFFEAIEQGTVPKSDLDPVQMERLKQSNIRAIRLRATDLLGARGVSPRAEVVAKYQEALKRKGDPAKGKAIFQSECAACHRFDGVGENFGAELGGIKDRGLESVMLNILDPNREVKPQYLSYSISLKDGRNLSGMIVSETATGVAIRTADHQTQTLPRSDIETLKSSPVSFMPEGLERRIDLQAMADLLSYLGK